MNFKYKIIAKKNYHKIYNKNVFVANTWSQKFMTKNRSSS